jgi:cob(I)alamin adenosyltransferase
MVMRIYTKTGDQGETSLFGGERVKKDHLRVEAYGDVDELNAALGLAVSLASEKSRTTAQLLQHVQALLFELGAQLATPPARQKQPTQMTAQDITMLEHSIDAMEQELAPLQSFILPGGSPFASALHVARSVCRRAERRVVTLRTLEPNTPVIVVTFLNRLSDFLFVVARYANFQEDIPDIVWQSREKN